MEITYEYNPETQKLIDEIEENIAYITKEYESILNPKTAKGYVEIARPGYRESIIFAYNERIKPYQKMLEEIHLTSVPKIIIKNIEKNYMADILKKYGRS